MRTGEKWWRAEPSQVKREPLQASCESSARRRRGEVGRASIVGLLLAGVIGAAVGAGWIQTRSYLGAAQQPAQEQGLDEASALFLGKAPMVVYRSPAAQELPTTADAAHPGSELKGVSVPRAGWEGRADHFGAGLALANP